MRKKYKNLVSKNFYIWGNGCVLKRYIKNIPTDIKIEAVIDSDKKKQGTVCSINGKNIPCISPVELDESKAVILAIENPKIANDVIEVLEKEKVEWCHLYDVIDYYYLKNRVKTSNVKSSTKIVKFIDAFVPVSKCNLRCKYCYISQNKYDLDGIKAFYHDAKYIRASLSQKRLGGSALINFCGVGETLLCSELLLIIQELVKEGHYIQIVTNCTVTSEIEKYIQSNIDFSKVFFKCSLHYQQLKEKKMLDIFEENVKKLERRGGSYTIELVPHDEIINEIGEIKEYCVKAFGAFPHVTVARDESRSDFRILSKYNVEQYKEIWGSFESKLFEYKVEQLDSQKNRFCHAGEWGYELNLANGELYKCTNNPRIMNIYEDIDVDIISSPVGYECTMPYCFNNHAYITLGLIPEIDAPFYVDVRDRVTKDGCHWIVDDMRIALGQKLYENNE